MKPEKEKEIMILSETFNSIAGFDDGSVTPKHVIGHKNQGK
jgi:hypothetical protein